VQLLCQAPCAIGNISRCGGKRLMEKRVYDDGLMSRYVAAWRRTRRAPQISTVPSRFSTRPRAGKWLISRAGEARRVAAQKRDVKPRMLVSLVSDRVVAAHKTRHTPRRANALPGPAWRGAAPLLRARRSFCLGSM